MARIIIKTAHGPHVLQTSEGEKHICMCGLSKNQPFCDGSHKKTTDENPDSLYQYDDELKRTELEEELDESEGCCGGGCCGGGCCSEEETEEQSSSNKTAKKA